MQAVAALRQQLQWGISCASAAAAYASLAAILVQQRLLTLIFRNQNLIYLQFTTITATAIIS